MNTTVRSSPDVGIRGFRTGEPILGDESTERRIRRSAKRGRLGDTISVYVSKDVTQNGAAYARSSSERDQKVFSYFPSALG